MTIAKDGLLVVRKTNPLSPPTELIVVHRSVLDGLVTALHIKLDHPSKHQLLLMMKRTFYALDMQAAVARVSDSSHMCVSEKVPSANCPTYNRKTTKRNTLGHLCSELDSLEGPPAPRFYCPTRRSNPETSWYIPGSWTNQEREQKPSR